MDRNDEPADPFAGLEDWAREAESRVRKEMRRVPRPARSRPAGSPDSAAGPSPLRAALLVAAVAAGAVALAMAVPGLRSLGSDGSGAAPAYPVAVVPSGVTVTTSESAAPTDPFAGTPAANYPKGAAGISMPAARPAGGFTAAQVGADLQEVRAELVAGRLDQRMLIGHQPDRFLARLAPNSHRDIQKWFTTRHFTGVATWIDPRVRLDPAEPPRVSGRVTYRPVSAQGVPTLRVTTNFIWVYAFAGPGHPLAAEHDQIAWDFPLARPVRPADRGMWVRDVESYSAWVDCAAFRRGLLAPTPAGDVSPRASGTEDPENYLRADHSLDVGDDCGATRTPASPAPAVSPS